jgi:hypothetical protein
MYLIIYLIMYLILDIQIIVIYALNCFYIKYKILNLKY